MNTKYIRWEPGAGIAMEELAQAKQIIAAGGLVAFPTETVYGLGGDGLQKEAARKIYAAKGRPSDNPLILHIYTFSQLQDIVDYIPETAQKLADAFWPGPLTMIFQKASCVPYETTGGLDTVAVRMPDHEGALEFLKAAAVPVAAPSANISGRPSPTRAEHVREDLDGKIDMIVDGGEVGIGYESTIVDVTGDVPIILRPGHITKQMLSEVVGEVVMDPALCSVDGDVAPKAPGMKYRHYAPKARMTVFRGETPLVVKRIRDQVEQLLASGQFLEERIGILATEETETEYPLGRVLTAGSRQRDDAGHYLYDVLRRFDELQVEIIFSESFDDSANREALMNRLLKAAGQQVVDVDEKRWSQDEL